MSNQSFWYELNLGERYGIGQYFSVMRVPGGWILSSPVSDVFIPFHYHKSKETTK